ncbi:transcription-repair coupling factor [soil metagenome]
MTDVAGVTAPELRLTDLPLLLEVAAGWAGLRAAIVKGQSGTVDGAWGSSASLAAAAIAAAAPAMVLVVLPLVTDLVPWAEDLAGFTGTRPTLFPAWETWPPPSSRGRLSPETVQRLKVLKALGEPGASATGVKVILAPIAALVQPVPPRDQFATQGRKLVVGESIDGDSLSAWLIDNDYKRVEAVEYPGEFARRGGILDLFPPDSLDPVRLEFFGDDLESLRVFAAETQRSREALTSIIVLPVDGKGAKGPAFFTDYLPERSIILLVEPADLQEQARHFLDRVADQTGLYSREGTFRNLLAHPTVNITAMPKLSTEATCHLTVESVDRFSGKVDRVKAELEAVAGTNRVLIACQTEAEVHRLSDVLKPMSPRLSLVTGHVKAGFRLVSAGVVVIGSHELFQRDVAIAPTKGVAASRRVESRAIDSFTDLNEGDYVVHIAHGIAKFVGMKMLVKGSVAGDADSRPETLAANERHEIAEEDNLILEFKGGVFLYVPASRIDLVQKYVGGAATEPELSKLGSASWGRRKDKVAEAVQDMAAEMLQVQAMRAGLPGEAMTPDTDWQAEFEAAFPYTETPDQAAAIQDVKADLQKPRPMDRLICGDVGYGKTEVAIRGVFKTIDNGKQVAILVPTTVLAEQHFRTLSQRLAEYPFVVEVVNRFRTAGQIKKVMKRLAEGEVDVLVGTHRLLSDDVKFKDLGLVIIDEEQRFGVEHKEKLKRLRSMVHILTMTATPIPRTLHASLVGIREISNLETPPPQRQPVETRIIRWDDEMIRHAIHREMNRGGQVFFVHNKVFDLNDVAAKVAYLAPDARIVVGHGQMTGHELEKAMVKFVRKEADILVATTIIESGVDIPNANTIFINDADMYGLADLHQLRGRVGRSPTRAYAYLIVNPVKLLTPGAQKRIRAIEEFSELGAGFKIAMRDLEIRGAGNILGAEQSGHIAAIGYEMYCHLLENAVRSLKQLPPKAAVEVNIDLPWPAYLPRDYVPGQKLRIEVYRRLARLRDQKTLEDFRQELIDRYGPIPEEAAWLLKTTEVRLACVKWQIASVHRDGRDLVFSYKNRTKADQVAALSGGRMKVVDEKSIYLRIKAEEDDTPAAIYAMLKRFLGC